MGSGGIIYPLFHNFFAETKLILGYFHGLYLLLSKIICYSESAEGIRLGWSEWALFTSQPNSIYFWSKPRKKTSTDGESCNRMEITGCGVRVCDAFVVSCHSVCPFRFLLASLSRSRSLSLFFSVSHSLSSDRSHRVTGGAEMHTWTSSLLISTAAIKDRPFFHSTPEGCELPAGPWLLLVFLNHFLFSSGCATSQSVSTARAASSPSSLDLLFCVVDWVLHSFSCERIKIFSCQPDLSFWGSAALTSCSINNHCTLFQIKPLKILIRRQGPQGELGRFILVRLLVLGAIGATQLLSLVLKKKTPNLVLIIQGCAVFCHCYADDAQVYLPLSSKDPKGLAS